MKTLRVVGNQIKRGRSLVGLSQEALASRTGLCVLSIRRYEQAADEAPAATVAALTRVIDALENAGVIFLPDGGVSLRRAEAAA